jgi:hypothetical protein
MAEQADTITPRTFLVERYWPDVDEARAREVESSLEAAARAMRAEGSRIGHIGSILMPRDGVTFSLIEASDEASARQVTARAGLEMDRIALAVWLPEGDR